MSETEKTEVEQVAELEPLEAPREWTFEDAGEKITFKQKQLAFHKKVQFFALLGQTVRQVTAVGGQGALGELLQGESIAEAGRQLGSRDTGDAEAFVNLASSLLAFVPDFLIDAQLLWLNVPIDEQRRVKVLLERGEDEGGLSDDEHVQMIETFVAQNWPAIKHFFAVLAPRIWKSIQSEKQQDEKKETIEEAVAE